MIESFLRHFKNNILAQSGANLEKITALGFFVEHFKPWGELGIGKLYIYIYIYAYSGITLLFNLTFLFFVSRFRKSLSENPENKQIYCIF